jgi:hypothetical protein
MKFRGPEAQLDTWDSPDIAMVCSRTSTIDWASHSSKEEFEVVIMIVLATEEMHGSDRDI